MLKKIKSNYFYSSILLSFFLFLPFLFSNNISSDWDSYAIIGTYLNFAESRIYIPSRPPGFPLYEIIVSLIISISNGIGINFEYLLLFFQFLSLIGLNLIIYKFIQKDNDLQNINYLFIVFSPIYIISGFTVIDYTLGALLGFSAIYLYFYSTKFKNSILFPSLLIAFSSAVRLSNLIYMLGLVVFLIAFKRENLVALKLFSLTLMFCFFLYLPFYINLYNFMSQTSDIKNFYDFLCVFNLTNTDQDLYNRIGRFTLKQINFFGTLGFLLFILSFKNYKLPRLNEKSYFIIIFLLFQLSFLRLPTEEGHLLPAFICLFLILKIKFNKLSLAVLLLVFFANFIDLKFYEVDVPNHASQAFLNIRFDDGLLIEDFKERAFKGLDKNFNYQNAKKSVYDAWSQGCPNV